MRRFIALTTILVSLSAPAFAGDTEVIRENMEMARRLENVAGPLLTGHAEKCGKNVVPYVGAEFLTADGVAEKYQDIMVRDYGAQMHPTVTMIAKGSPADGRLKVRDVVTDANHQPIQEGADGRFDLIDILKANYDPVSLNVQRGGQTVDVLITPVPACDVKVRLGGDGINADGNIITVSKDTLKNTASDKALSQAVELVFLDMVK